MLFWGSLIYVCSWLVVAVFNRYLFYRPYEDDNEGITFALLTLLFGPVIAAGLILYTTVGVVVVGLIEGVLWLVLTKKKR